MVTAVKTSNLTQLKEGNCFRAELLCTWGAEECICTNGDRLWWLPAVHMHEWWQTVVVTSRAYARMVPNCGGYQPCICTNGAKLWWLPAVHMHEWCQTVGVTSRAYARMVPNCGGYQPYTWRQNETYAALKDIQAQQVALGQIKLTALLFVAKPLLAFVISRHSIDSKDYVIDADESTILWISRHSLNWCSSHAWTHQFLFLHYSFCLHETQGSEWEMGVCHQCLNCS
jgi:hypothetical protein